MTGAGLNPARAFGPLLVSGQLGDNFGTFLFVYTLGPIVGALIARARSSGSTRASSKRPG